jgi:hypothetical protein
MRAIGLALLLSLTAGTNAMAYGKPVLENLGMVSDLPLKQDISPKTTREQAMNNEHGAYMQELMHAIDRGEMRLDDAIKLYREKFFNGEAPPATYTPRSPLPQIPWSK